MIVGSEHLRHLSPGRHVPAKALLVSGAMPRVDCALGAVAQNAIATIISFASVGIYIAFQMIVLGSAGRARTRLAACRQLSRSARWAWPVNIAALGLRLGRDRQHVLAAQPEGPLV